MQKIFYSLVVILCFSLINQDTFAQCSGLKAVVVSITTDNTPAQNSGSVVDAVTGSVYLNFGPYAFADKNKTFNYNINLPNTATVLFSIYDTGGNGGASFSVTSGSDTYVSGSGNWGDEYKRYFTTCAVEYDLMVYDSNIKPLTLGGEYYVVGYVQNLGSKSITKADLHYRKDNGPVVSKFAHNFTPPIQPGQTTTFLHNIKKWCADGGDHDITIWASNLNGTSEDQRQYKDKLIVHTHDPTAFTYTTVLVEEFTQASCGPCASQNPAFNALLETVKDKIAAIKYHTWWPGYDPMYNENTPDNNTRIGYYNVNGVPHVELQGNVKEGSPSSYTANDFNDIYNNPNSMAFEVDETLSGSTANISVTVKPFADINLNNLHLRVMIIEDPVSYSTPPGTNGETVFPHVLRKTVLDQTLPPLTANNNLTYSTASYTFPSYVVPSKLRTVVFIQDDSDKAVLQSYVTPNQTGTNVDVGNTIYYPANCPPDVTTDVPVKVKSYLQGAFDANTSEMRTTLLANNMLPTAQPFNTTPWNYNGTETVANFPTNTVDWVLIEVRDPVSYALVDQKAGLLQKDGTVLNVDGNDILMNDVFANTVYYLAIRSRNHLDILGARLVSLPNVNTYDLTDPNAVAGTNQVVKLGNTSIYGMRAGDINGDGYITVADYNLYSANASKINIYHPSDLNLDRNITVSDFNLYQPNSSSIAVSQMRY